MRVDEGMQQDITAIMKSENDSYFKVPSQFVLTLVFGAATEGSLLQKSTRYEMAPIDDLLVPLPKAPI